MTANRLRALPRWACECKRCGHKWVSTGPKPPARCASCTFRNWQAEPGSLKRGPKPAKPAVLELLIRDKARKVNRKPKRTK